MLEERKVQYEGQFKAVHPVKGASNWCHEAPMWPIVNLLIDKDLTDFEAKVPTVRVWHCRPVGSVAKFENPIG
jgi:hypothetical protein